VIEGGTSRLRAKGRRRQLLSPIPGDPTRTNRAFPSRRGPIGMEGDAGPCGASLPGTIYRVPPYWQRMRRLAAQHALTEICLLDVNRGHTSTAKTLAAKHLLNKGFLTSLM
jgi:hypothetical protein